MNWSVDKCPVTQETAQEALPRMGDYSEHICPTCGRFRISGSSREAIRHYRLNERVAFLDEAKRRAAKGEIPFISGIG